MRQHGLIDIARRDVLLDRPHARLVHVACQVGPQLRRPARRRTRCRRQAALELAFQELDLRARELVERRQILVRGHPRVRDDQNPVLDVIEREHRVEQHEARVVCRCGGWRLGAGGRVVPGSSFPRITKDWLEHHRCVVSDKSNGAARETRQIGHIRRAEFGHQPAQHGHERFAGLRRHARALDDRLPAARTEDEERVFSEEGVPRDLLAALHALEEKRIVGVLGDLQKRGDRREQVRHDFLHDRHKRTAPRQVHELIKRRLFHII